MIEQIQIILFIVIVAAVIVTALVRLGVSLFLKYGNTETRKCPKCKGTMIIAKSRLYVLPTCFNETHKQCADYYFENAVPISDESQIPKGNQSCYIHTLQCQSCGFRNVSVVDFLKVRDKEVLKDAEEYPFELFQNFLEEQP